MNAEKRVLAAPMLRAKIMMEITHVVARLVSLEMDTLALVSIFTPKNKKNKNRNFNFLLYRCG